MSRRLRFTLLADGTSDRALLPILRWTIEQLDSATLIVEGEVADLRGLPTSYRNSLGRRIKVAVELFPCDLLVVHRDAEHQDRVDERLLEIQHAVSDADLGRTATVPVIPVRMTEAWLLVDEAAIRAAASNPNGRTPLCLPPVHEIEGVQAKEVLFNLLTTASELPPRRLKRFDRYSARARVAECMSDFSRLRSLSSFRRFESTVRETCGPLVMNQVGNR